VAAPADSETGEARLERCAGAGGLLQARQRARQTIAGAIGQRGELGILAPPLRVRPEPTERLSDDNSGLAVGQLEHGDRRRQQDAVARIVLQRLQDNAGQRDFEKRVLPKIVLHRVLEIPANVRAGEERQAFVAQRMRQLSQRHVEGQFDDHAPVIALHVTSSRARYQRPVAAVVRRCGT
jgi:hypothetical protein